MKIFLTVILLGPIWIIGFVMLLKYRAISEKVVKDRDSNLKVYTTKKLKEMQTRALKNIGAMLLILFLVLVCCVFVSILLNILFD